MLRRTSAFHAKYRFFFVDMVEIARHYPKLIRRFRKFVTLRVEEYDCLLNELLEKRLLKPEPVPGLYQSLFRSIWTVSTFWQAHRLILGDQHPLIQSTSDTRQVWEIMAPHFTAKGWRELQSICVAENCCALQEYLRAVS
jgi:hypothetical protein